MANEEQLKAQILANSHLTDKEKTFLISSLPQLDKLETLKLTQNLASGNVPFLLKQVSWIKNQYQSELDKEKPSTDPISKIVRNIFPPKERKPVSFSLFSKPDRLGSKPSVAITSPAPAITSLLEITDPAQLKYISPLMIDDIENTNFQQELIRFLKKCELLFQKIDSIETKRNYFLTYMKSPLFSSYISTGLTAMKHDELKPRKISLNLLYQIDSKYLNSKQFKIASQITSHLREIVSL